MADTIASLLEPPTMAGEEEILASVFADQKMPISDWFVGSVARTMVKAIAKCFVSVKNLRAVITSGGYLYLAAGLKDADGNEVRGWLDLLGMQFYKLARAEATATIQRCLVACAAGSGPQTLTQGNFIAIARPSGNRYVYQGAAPVVVADGGTASVDLTAENPGAAYADPSGSIIEVVTSMPGVSITHPSALFGGLGLTGQAAAGTGNVGTGTVTPSGTPVLTRQLIVTVTGTGKITIAGGAVLVEALIGGVRSTVVASSPIPATLAVGDGVTLTFANGAGAGFIVADVFTFQTPGSPIIKQGSDMESNLAYADRCSGRWPELSPNAVDDKYVQWIRQCSIDNGLGIEKIAIQASETIGGLAEILVATATGAPSGGTITILNTYVRNRGAITEKSTITGASNANVNIGGTVTASQSTVAAVQAAADTAWEDYIESLPIGGDRKTGTPGVVRLSELGRILKDAGAVDHAGLTLNASAANLALAYSDVPVVPAGQLPSQALSWNLVP